MYKRPAPFDSQKKKRLYTGLRSGVKNGSSMFIIIIIKQNQRLFGQNRKCLVVSQRMSDDNVKTDEKREKNLHKYGRPPPLKLTAQPGTQAPRSIRYLSLPPPHPLAPWSQERRPSVLHNVSHNGLISTHSRTSTGAICFPRPPAVEQTLITRPISSADESIERSALP